MPKWMFAAYTVVLGPNLAAYNSKFFKLDDLKAALDILEKYATDNKKLTKRIKIARDSFLLTEKLNKALAGFVGTQKTTQEIINKLEDIASDRILSIKKEIKDLK